jgi:hypothetical protein
VLDIALGIVGAATRARAGQGISPEHGSAGPASGNEGANVTQLTKQDPKVEPHRVDNAMALKPQHRRCGLKPYCAGALPTEVQANIAAETDRSWDAATA